MAAAGLAVLRSSSWSRVSSSSMRVAKLPDQLLGGVPHLMAVLVGLVALDQRPHRVENTGRCTPLDGHPTRSQENLQERAGILGRPRTHRAAS